MTDQATNVIALKPRKTSAFQSRPNTILERIYAAGSVALGTDDIPTRMAAVMLQALGFVVIEEILPDGTSRRVEKGKAKAAMDRPWRLAKPAFSGTVGIPDGDGAFRSAG